MKRSLVVFCSCLAGLTLLAFGVTCANSALLHRTYPYNTFLFDPLYSFTDFTAFYGKIKDLAAGGEAVGREPRFNYPAPALYVYAFFMRLFPLPLLAYVIFTAGTAFAALATLGAVLHRASLNLRWVDVSLIVAGLCSYPFMLLIDRGNIEGVVWWFTFLGLAAFVRKRYLPSALFIAAAVCVKPFPALLFFLFLRHRRYKEIAVGLAAVCAANLIALNAVGPTVAAAWEGLHQGISTYVYRYIATVRFKEIGFDHSLFSCLKQLMRLALGWHADYTFQSSLLAAYTIWTVDSALIILAAGFFFWRKPVLNQLFAVVVLILLLPPISPDYALIYLYLPWGAFMIFLIRDVGSGRVELSLGKCLWVLIPCAVLMSPQSYLILGGVGFGGQVKALTLLLLLCVVARIDMPGSLFDELPPRNPREDPEAILRTCPSMTLPGAI